MGGCIGVLIGSAGRRLVPLLGLSFALAVLVAVAPRAANAAPGASAEAPNTVYFDAKSMRFNAPLRSGTGRTVEVFTLLPGNSEQVELIYWPRRGKKCEHEGETLDEVDEVDKDPWTPPKDSVLRSALRGAKEGDDHRFIATLGPLRINVEYCFLLRANVPKPLSPALKARIATALTKTIEAAGTWIDVDESPHFKECHQPKELSGRSLSRCELGKEFAKQIGAPTAARPVVAPDGSGAMRLDEAFEQVLASQPDLGRALDDVVGIIASRRGYKEDRAKLKELQGLPYRYDPLAGLELADVVAIAPRTLRKKYEKLPTGTNEPEWAALLWADREAFIAVITTAKAWDEVKLDGKDEKKKVLHAFFFTDGKRREQQPRSLEVLEDEVTTLLGVVLMNEPTVASKQALDTARDERPLSELSALPPAAGLEAIIEYATMLSRLQDFAGNILDVKAKLAALATGTSATAKVLDALVGLDELASFGVFAWEPTFEQRFPFYASADLGLAGALIPLRDREPRFELAAYFGVNLYFTAVDKSEPLGRPKHDVSRLRNFGRRFALTAGLSVIRPRLNDDLGVGGVLRNQVLLFGAGYRVLDYLRVGGGVMIYRQNSPNPLSDKTLVRTSPYLSLSMDIDVIGTIRGWYDKAKTAAAQ